MAPEHVGFTGLNRMPATCIARLLQKRNGGNAQLIIGPRLTGQGKEGTLHRLKAVASSYG